MHNSDSELKKMVQAHLEQIPRTSDEIEMVSIGHERILRMAKQCYESQKKYHD